MPRFVSGLDLGQSSDYSALVVTECETIPDPDRLERSINRFDVRHIRRWQLGTKYTAIVADLRLMFNTGHLRNSTLVIDRTGVGAGVSDMISEAGLCASVRPFAITAGLKPGDGTVPKCDLVGAVQAALQTRRLRFADALELTPTLEKELETFRVKVTADRNETFSAWREKDHDDLVLALALAVWYGEQCRASAGSYSTDYEPESGIPADTFR